MHPYDVPVTWTSIFIESMVHFRSDSWSDKVNKLTPFLDRSLGMALNQLVKSNIVQVQVLIDLLWSVYIIYK